MPDANCIGRNAAGIQAVLRPTVMSPRARRPRKVPQLFGRFEARLVRQHVRTVSIACSIASESGRSIPGQGIAGAQFGSGRSAPIM